MINAGFLISVVDSIQWSLHMECLGRDLSGGGEGYSGKWIGSCRGSRGRWAASDSTDLTRLQFLFWRTNETACVLLGLQGTTRGWRCGQSDGFFVIFEVFLRQLPLCCTLLVDAVSIHDPQSECVRQKMGGHDTFERDLFSMAAETSKESFWRPFFMRPYVVLTSGRPSDSATEAAPSANKKSHWLERPLCHSEFYTFFHKYPCATRK